MESRYATIQEHVDDIIYEVLTDELLDSNQQNNVYKWNFILAILDVDNLVVTENFDFSLAYHQASGHALQAAVWLAWLQYSCFTIFMKENVGLHSFNDMKTADCLYNYWRLQDKLNAELSDKPMEHRWLQ